MADRETASVEIETDGGPIDAWELSYFLYLFRAAYVFAADRVFESRLSPYSSPAEFAAYARHLAKEMSLVEDIALISIARKRVQPELSIIDIRRENPLEILFGGIAVALTVAVIISGGEVKGLGMKVKLPPLGTGIAKLREAFGKKSVPKGRK